MKHKLESRLLEEISITSDTKMTDTTLTTESEEELTSLFMKVKEESEKASLKLNIKKTKIMASSPITQWQIDWKSGSSDILFSWAPESLWMVTATMKFKDTCSLEGKL